MQHGGTILPFSTWVKRGGKNLGQIKGGENWVTRETGHKFFANVSHFTHLKKSHLALGSSALPSPLAQHQNCRPKFGPFFFTVLKTEISPWPLHFGAEGGPLKMDFQAVAVWERFSKVSSKFVSSFWEVFDITVGSGSGCASDFLMKKLLSLVCWDCSLVFFGCDAVFKSSSLCLLADLEKKFDIFCCFPENSGKNLAQKEAGRLGGTNSKSISALTGQWSLPSVSGWISQLFNFGKRSREAKM